MRVISIFIFVIRRDERELNIEMIVFNVVLIILITF